MTIKEKNRKILFVADIRGHAFDHIAQKLATALSAEVIHSDYFASNRDLLQAILASKATIVHFFWRKRLEWFLNENKAALKRHSEIKFTFSVPDHLYSDEKALASMFPLFANTAGYLVSSRRLHRHYSTQGFVKKPLALVHDFITLPEAPIENRNYRQERALKVLWIGNSEWGIWEGLKDHKGLATVIVPAVEIAKSAGANIALKVIDSAKFRVPHMEVLREMDSADIIVQASESEGTGMPLVEGMARGLIPISTDVGVAGEVMTGKLAELIARRTPDSFAELLHHLDANRDALTELSALAMEMALTVFSDKRQENEWADFFEIVRKKSNVDQSHSFDPIYRALRHKPVSKLANALYRNSRLVRALANLYFEKLEVLSVQRFKPELISGSESLAVYHPGWSGIRASTGAMFSHTLAIPLSANGGKHTDRVVTAYSDLILRTGAKSLVFSGGDAFHRDIAKAVKRANPEIEISLMWHGAPTLFVSGIEGHQFASWLKLAQEGVLSEFNVLKKGLEILLTRLGIRSILHSNVDFVTANLISHKKLSDLDGRVHIGVFASSGAWWKNLPSQILGAALIDNVRIHLIEGSIENYILELVPPGVLEFHPGPIKHSEFQDLLGSMDIVTYTTVTEASPMIPIEAITNGTPVVLGTSTDYPNYPVDLKPYIAPSNDDISEIHRAIQETLMHSNKVLELQQAYVLANKFKTKETD